MNKRGKSDAPLMAKLLKKKNIFPDLILTSTAVRAFDFAKIIADELDYKRKKIVASENLYMSGEDEMFKMVRSVDDSNDILFMVGHNPDLTYFANSLSDYHVDNIPTSGIVTVEFDVNKWKNVEPGKGKFVSFEYPKKYI